MHRHPNTEWKGAEILGLSQFSATLVGSCLHGTHG